MFSTTWQRSGGRSFQKGETNEGGERLLGDRENHDNGDDNGDEASIDMIAAPSFGFEKFVFILLIYQQLSKMQAT